MFAANVESSSGLCLPPRARAPAVEPPKTPPSSSSSPSVSLPTGASLLRLYHAFEILPIHLHQMLLRLHQAKGETPFLLSLTSRQERRWRESTYETGCNELKNAFYSGEDTPGAREDSTADPPGNLPTLPSAITGFLRETVRALPRRRIPGDDRCIDLQVENS